jgi:hypothetical protein
LEIDSACHFEILCCFRFHRILDKKPAGLLNADSLLDALKLPLLGIWRTPVCCRAASNVGKQIAVQCRQAPATGNAASRLRHLDKARKIIFWRSAASFRH